MANIINHLLTHTHTQIYFGGNDYPKGIPLLPSPCPVCVESNPIYPTPALLLLRKLALHLHFLFPFTLISNLNKSPAVFVHHAQARVCVCEGVSEGGVCCTPHACGLCRRPRRLLLFVYRHKSLTIAAPVASQTNPRRSSPPPPPSLDASLPTAICFFN